MTPPRWLSVTAQLVCLGAASVAGGAVVTLLVFAGYEWARKRRAT